MGSADKKVKKKKKKIAKCPLFIMICLTITGMMAFGVIMSAMGEYEWKLTWEHPVFAAVLLDERPVNEPEPEPEPVQKVEEAPVVTDAVKEATDIMAEEPSSDAVEEESSEEEEVIISDEEYMEMYGEIPYYIEDGGAVKYITWDTGEPRSRYYSNTGVRPITSEYHYTHIGNPDYYENCLFIGDSRIGGLGTYSGWNKAFFAYKNGTSVYNIMEANLSVINGMNATLPELLEVGPYRMIFIMLGINEIGMDTADYGQRFGEILATIREYQPETPIVIMGNTFVTKERDNSDNVTNNANINDKNAAIACYANGEDIFYFDVNPALVDEEGYLRSDITRDGVHITAQHYHLWVDWMNEHGFYEGYEIDPYAEEENSEGTDEGEATENGEGEAVADGMDDNSEGGQ